MTSPTTTSVGRRRKRPSRWVVRGRTALAAFYLVCAAVHVGLATMTPERYREFADQALFGFVTARWGDVFMAAPTAWGLAVAVGETSLGLALLAGGGWRRLGYAGILGFNAALMLFGWGFWLWSVPARAVVGLLAVHDDLLDPPPA